MEATDNDQRVLVEIEDRIEKLLTRIYIGGSVSVTSMSDHDGESASHDGTALARIVREEDDTLKVDRDGCEVVTFERL